MHAWLASYALPCFQSSSSRWQSFRRVKDTLLWILQRFDRYLFKIKRYLPSVVGAILPHLPTTHPTSGWFVGLAKCRRKATIKNQQYQLTNTYKAPTKSTSLANGVSLRIESASQPTKIQST
jgi:hypothetical protein